MAHAEADFEGARRTAAKHLIEVAQAVGQLQAELGQALLKATLLAFGHASGAHDKALDGAHVALFLGRCRRLVRFSHGSTLE